MARHWPIVTHRPQVPWHWMLLMALAGLPGGYVEFCSGGPLTFTVKKFVNDPAAISFLISINTAFNFLVGVGAAYLSDHIWTRFGRRRVFLVPGWMMVALFLLLVPLMPSLGWLAVVIIGYQFGQDFGASNWQALLYEVVPPPQRGRMGMLSSIAGSLFGLFLNLVLLAQYDRRYRFRLPWDGGQLTGEQVIYWFGAVLLLSVVLFLSFGIRETLPPRPPDTTKPSPLQFLREAYGSRQWRILYLLCVGVCITAAGLATNTTLMLTEQFGYSKQTLGQLAAIGMVFNLLAVAPAVGWLVDRVPRLRLTQTGLCGILLTNTGYYIYLRFFAPGHVPPLPVLIGLGMMNVVWGSLWVLSHTPNIFDYLPSNKYGTFNAGSNLIIGILLFLLPNAYGLWVRTYSRWFCPPGTYDYTSAYLLNILLATLGVALSFYFRHCVKTGQLVRYGQIELQEELQQQNNSDRTK